MANKWARAPKLALWPGEADGQGRAYVLPGTDERFPSVTTVLRNTPKADLMGWAAMKVAERARDRPDIVMGDPDKVVDRLRYAHTDFRDERAEIGTGVHQTIQAEYEESWEFPVLDAEQRAMMANWYRFCEEYEVEILHSEFTVFGDGYAGTADAIIQYRDPITREVRLALVDFKTSKAIHDEHFMQLSALAAGRFRMLEVTEDHPEGTLRKGKTKAQNSWWIREEMPKFDEVAVLQLREDYYRFEVVENLDLWYGQFKCYVNLFELQAQMKERNKNA